jgi:hypothetical protein
MRAELQKKLQVLVTMWGAITMSVFVFGLMLYVVGPAEEGSGAIAPVLALVGVSLAPGLFVVRRQMLGPTLGLWAPPEAQEGPPAAPLTGAALEEALARDLNRYQAGTFVGLAMGEAIAVIGFLASFLTGDFTWYLALVGLSAVVLIVQIPRLDGLLGVAEPGLRAAIRREG